MRKIPLTGIRIHVPTCQKVTRLLLSYRVDNHQMPQIKHYKTLAPVSAEGGGHQPHPLGGNSRTPRQQTPGCTRRASGLRTLPMAHDDGSISACGGICASCGRSWRSPTPIKDCKARQMVVRTKRREEYHNFSICYLLSLYNNPSGMQAGYLLYSDVSRKLPRRHAVYVCTLLLYSTSSDL